MKKELSQVPDVCRTMKYSSLASALLAGFGCGVAVGKVDHDVQSKL